MKYLIFFLTAIAFGQQSQFVDFKSVSGKIAIDPKERTVAGDVKYTFQVLKATDTISIDAQNMTFSNVKINGEEIAVVTTQKVVQLVSPFKIGTYNLTLQYEAKPRQTMYFMGDLATSDLQIWTQGQGKYTSHWFPSFDDVNEKLVFNLNIDFDAHYTVVSNGILKHKTTAKGVTSWNYQMEKPMSSYLLMLAIGKWDQKTEISKSKIPLEMFLESKDSLALESTYRYTKVMFDFLEKEIGVPYPWEIYRQLPVRDFLYAGMENTTATLFNTRYVVDAIGFEDRSYTTVNAHELAHQWFGNLITAESSTHHWLQEGFATYYALLAEREIYGEDYFYFKLYESAQQLKFASRTDPIPVLNAKASSLTFYQKGAWALFVLHNEIGDKAFKKAISNYLKNNAFHNVNTATFFNEVNKVTAYDLENFSKIWLESTAFDTAKANALLSKNKGIQLLLEIEKLKTTPFAEKKVFFEKVMRLPVYFAVKEAILNQIQNEKWEVLAPFYTIALDSNNIQLRQVVASSMQVVPEFFRLRYETLLNDKSYQTQEIALYTLCNSFPDLRIRYLDQSKKWMGFNDHNLKIMWLALAIATPDYLVDVNFYKQELIQYASSSFEANCRQNALEKLLAFQFIDETVLIHLVQATTHHMWQFSKFGRDSIRRLLKNPTLRTSFELVLPKLNEKEQAQLSKLLAEQQS